MYPEVSMNVVRRRVLVAGARFAGLSPVAAGTAVARGFAGSSEVALVPFAAGGSDLGVALAHLGDGVVERGAGGWTAVGPGWLAAGLDDAVAGARFDPEAGSAGIGRHLARALSGGQRVAEVMVDLTGVDAHDAGAGLLAALGARADGPLDAGAAALADLGTVDLDPVRELLAGVALLGIVPPGDLDAPLVGLRGVIAGRGFDAGVARAEVLRLDEAVAHYAGLVAPGIADEPGTGAAGGAAFAVRALGGRLVTGVGLCAERAGLARTLARADVVITACDRLDVGNRGGLLLAELIELTERAERPLVVLAREVGISGRELRTFGVESAHQVGTGDDPAAALQAVAARVARDWNR